MKYWDTLEKLAEEFTAEADKRGSTMESTRRFKRHAARCRALVSVLDGDVDEWDFETKTNELVG